MAFVIKIRYPIAARARLPPLFHDAPPLRRPAFDYIKLPFPFFLVLVEYHTPYRCAPSLLPLLRARAPLPPFTTLL